MSHPTLSILLCLMAFLCHPATAQTDSSAGIIQQLPDKYIKKVDAKIDRYSSRLTGKTEKTLIKLSRWENKIHALLQKASPEAAGRLFAPGQPTFSSLLQKLREGKQVTENYKAGYNEYRDKLSTGLQYIQQQKAQLDSGIIRSAAATSEKLKQLDGDLANSDAITQFIKERKKQLVDVSFQYIGKSKYLAKINKESYYYVETLKNYKEIFSDPAKAEKTATDILNKIPAFKQFMQQNSMLASLFKKPDDYGTAQSLAGLQTREGVNAMVQNRLAAGGPNAKEMFSQNMQAAQAELTKIKDKLQKPGGEYADERLPDFKPNTQKTKTFLQRVEFGMNFQFAKSSSLLPSSTDIGLTAGYKLNDKSTVGLGVSYKVGLGSIQRISITHQGIGFRSYVDWKLKKQFFISGGYEMNYNAAFKKISQLKDMESWQRSGLIGISKKLPMKTKLVKNTKVQLLYDILYNTHLPQTQPFIFRMGYSF